METSLLGDDAPKVVPIITVKATGEKRGRKPGGKNSKSSAVVVQAEISDKDISQLLEWVFRIPTIYGWGAHWELSGAELKELTEKTRAVLDQFPETLLEKYGAVTSKWFAPVSLLISVATLCYSRYTTTLLIQKYELPDKPFTKAATGANRAAKQSEIFNNVAGNTGVGNGQNTANGKADIDSIFGSIE